MSPFYVIILLGVVAAAVLSEIFFPPGPPDAFA